MLRHYLVSGNGAIYASCLVWVLRVRVMREGRGPFRRPSMHLRLTRWTVAATVYGHLIKFLEF